MVSRHQVTCLACNGSVILRVQVSATMDPHDSTSSMAFVASCPHCSVLLHALLTSTPGQPSLVALVSSDVLEAPLDKSILAPTLTVATDVPVHLDLIAGNSATYQLTPFIRLWQVLDHDGRLRLSNRVARITQLHQDQYPALRRSVDTFNRGDREEAVRLLYGDEAPRKNDRAPLPPAVLIGFAIRQSFEPLGSTDAVDDGRRELYELMAAAAARDPKALRAESVLIQQGGLPRHRSDVLTKVMTILGDPDPLIAACSAEELLRTSRLDEFRVMRDDFEVLKSRFLDVFELGSITIAYWSRISNIANRGDPSDYGDGKKLSLKNALRTKAEVREAWLVDLPAAQPLFEPVQRRWRNLIGHHLVRNNLARGTLLLNDGSELDYLSFLETYLAAARLCQYLAEAVIVITRLDDTIVLAS